MNTLAALPHPKVKISSMPNLNPTADLVGLQCIDLRFALASATNLWTSEEFSCLCLYVCFGLPVFSFVMFLLLTYCLLLFTYCFVLLIIFFFLNYISWVNNVTGLLLLSQDSCTLLYSLPPVLFYHSIKFR